MGAGAISSTVRTSNLAPAGGPVVAVQEDPPPGTPSLSAEKSFRRPSESLDRTKSLRSQASSLQMQDSGLSESVVGDAKDEAGPQKSPEQAANWLSKLTFWWLRGLIKKGWKKPLELEDLPLLPEGDWADTVAPRFAKHFEHEEKKGERSLFRPILKTFWAKLVVTGILQLIYVLLGLTSPLFLNSTLTYIQQGQNTGNFMYKVFGHYYGYYSAAALLVVPTIALLVQNQFQQMSFRMGVQCKTALIVTVYGKSLKLSNAARQEKSVGEIVTLMQVDTDKVSQTVPFLHITWSGLVQIFGNLGILIYYIGWPAIVGFLVLVVTVPTQGRLVNKMMNMQRSIMKNTSARVKIVNEVLQGMRVVKSYAWESPFQDAVKAVRGQELGSMRRRVFYRALMVCIMLSNPAVIMVVTFAFYAGVAHYELDPATVFTAVSLFNSLRAPLMMYPFIINALLSGQVSLKRLARFVSLPELPPNRITNLDAEDAAGAPVAEGPNGEHSRPGSVDSDVMLKVEKSDFRWAGPPPEAVGLTNTGKHGVGATSFGARTVAGLHAGARSFARIGSLVAKPFAGKKAAPAQVVAAKEEPKQEEPFALLNINMEVKRGQLVAVVGPVGSGKSSLTSALLGEMDQRSGPPVAMRGTMAFCTQQAWIMNSTLRENVLFGRKMEPERYQRVLSACALNEDLAVLPDGDLTEIGERGINLSGGQKQRVSLARAAYADADIYILDDPLSAVDAHVGAHLFQNCITGLLANKTRIFVTNQLQYVPAVDQIVMLKDGQVVLRGTYDQLMVSGSEFEALMKSSGADSNSVQQGDLDAAVRKGRADYREKKKADKMDKSVADKGGKQRLAKREKGTGKLVEAEGRAKGNLKLSVYKKYWTEASILVPVMVFSLFGLVQAIDAYNRYWLSYWTENKFDQPLGFYLGIYAGLAIAYAFFIYIRTLGFFLLGLWTARILHEGILESIMRAPMAFFDTTPVGRILNRFSMDQSYIDENLSMSWNMFLNMLFSAAGSFIVIIIVTPWFLAVLAPMAVIYAYMQQIYRRTARELKRVDAVTKSPIYQQFTETLNGLPTIRAYRQQDRFNNLGHVKLDNNNRAFFLLRSCDRWLSVRLGMMGNFMVAAAALLAIVKKNIYAGQAGISIDYALAVTQSLTMLVQNMTDTENQMNAVERMYEYRDGIELEAAPIVENNRPDPSWPQQGAITVSNLSMRYREGLRLVLEDVSFSVAPGEKIGVVGRTGSGKSSLMLCLFRLVEPAAGSIIIDGVDISQIGLEDLRSKLSIIPQDPVLFSGTVRSNLDPFEKYSDADLWLALERAHLKNKVSSLTGKLEAEVVEYGENFSVGERQLLCLARVLLRNSRVLIMDEATSSVDFETDRLIQATIRTHLQDTTMLIIAHRINTVIDASRILLLEDGHLEEYDPPAVLLDRPDSKFAALVQATGDESAEHLRRVARGEEDYFAAYEKLQKATDVDVVEDLVESGEKAHSLEETDATKVDLGSRSVEQTSSDRHD